MTTFLHPLKLGKILLMNEEDFKQRFGQQIRTLRKNKKLTQEALAELIGLDTQHLCKIENGSHFPTLKNLIKLANIFNLNVQDLFSFENNKDNMTEKIELELKQFTSEDRIFIDKFFEIFTNFKKNL